MNTVEFILKCASSLMNYHKVNTFCKCHPKSGNGTAVALLKYLMPIPVVTSTLFPGGNHYADLCYHRLVFLIFEFYIMEPYNMYFGVWLLLLNNTFEIHPCIASTTSFNFIAK